MPRQDEILNSMSADELDAAASGEDSPLTESDAAIIALLTEVRSFHRSIEELCSDNKACHEQIADNNERIEEYKRGITQIDLALKALRSKDA